MRLGLEWVSPRLPQGRWEPSLLSLIYYFLSEIPSPLYEITLIGFFFLSVWISENAEIFLGKKDDQRIVIDEVIGFLITMLWVPKTIRFIIIGFFLFRFFDILKPFPIRRLEKGFKGRIWSCFG